jgi:hypothetical protein
MSDNGRSLVEAMHREAVEKQRCASVPAPLPAGIPWMDLAPAAPGDVFFHEWNTYCREIGRLLAEGNEGRHVLIKADEIIGIYESWDAAREAGLRRYLLEPFFVHPIRPVEPYVRLRGVNTPCPS